MSEKGYRRHSTKFPGVYYRIGTHRSTGKPERIYYIAYWRDGNKIEEKAGRQYQDDMTPSRASAIRARKIEGEPPRREIRQAKRAAAADVANRWTFDRLWEMYKEQSADKPSLKDDSSRYEIYIRPNFGDKVPSEIVPLDVDRLKKKVLESKDHRVKEQRKSPKRTRRKPASSRNVLELLRRLINFGEKKQLAMGPGFKIHLPRVNNQRTEFLTDEQAGQLLAVLAEWPDQQVANMLRLALFTGMRRGELFNLEWQDIDFERGFIRIREPKGGVDQTIPLNDMARAVLKEHPRTNGTEYVFPGKKGRKRQDAKRSVRAIYKAAGIPGDFRPFHGLRHTFASALASSGEVDMYVLQKLMTHKSPIMTQRYAHLRDDTLKRGANVISQFVRVSEKQAKKLD